MNVVQTFQKFRVRVWMPCRTYRKSLYGYTRPGTVCTYLAEHNLANLDSKFGIFVLQQMVSINHGTGIMSRPPWLESRVPDVRNVPWNGARPTKTAFTDPSCWKHSTTILYINDYTLDTNLHPNGSSFTSMKSIWRGFIFESRGHSNVRSAQSSRSVTAKIAVQQIPIFDACWCSTIGLTGTSKWPVDTTWTMLPRIYCE